MQSQHFSELQLLLQYFARCDIYPKFTKWRFSRRYRYRFASGTIGVESWVESYARR